LRAAGGLATTALLAGCGFLPRDGAAPSALASQASANLVAPNDAPVLDYVLLDIDRKAVALFGTPLGVSLYATFGSEGGPAPNITIGVGDVVQVTIFESQAGGLFIPADAGSRAGNFVTLPNQTIDRKGVLTVPYAGDIPAVGRTIPELQQVVDQALAQRAIEPQTVITVVSRSSSQASVVGAVTTPSKIEIGPAGERVLGVIAKANGITAPGYETYVTVERGDRRATVYFDAILADSKENIYIKPSDVIYVYREPHKYVAFGAVKTPGQMDFGARDLSLVEAIAKTNGLDDARADPHDVFLYRFAPRDLLARAGVSLARFPTSQKTIPVVFRANFRDPSSYFAATTFQIANKDVIYVSNASAYELYKVLTLLSSVAYTFGYTPAVTVGAYKTIAALGQ
jgi:polysaccharide biosynthesis/export protein